VTAAAVINAPCSPCRNCESSWQVACAVKSSRCFFDSFWKKGTRWNMNRSSPTIGFDGSISVSHGSCSSASHWRCFDFEYRFFSVVESIS